MGFQHNGTGYDAQINGTEPEEVQINGTTVWQSVQWIDDFSHGDINNYPSTVLYGEPYTFSIHQNGTVVNDSGYCLELTDHSTRGGVSTMPSDNLVQYYPQVGDTFECRGYVDDFYTASGGDHHFFGFGLNSGGDDSNCIFLRFRGNGRVIDIMEGWGNTIAEKEVWTINNEPSGGGEFWFEVDWTDGNVSADFYTEKTGYETNISANYSASKGRGIAWAGDCDGWSEALHLGAKML